MSRRQHLNRPETVKVAGPYPASDEIAARAHELFMNGGHSLKDLEAHWRAAEQELLQRSAARVVRLGEPASPDRSRRRQD